MLSSSMTDLPQSGSPMTFFRRNARLIAGASVFVIFWMLVYAFFVYAPRYAAKAVVIIKDSAITGRYVEPAQYYALQTTSSSSSNPVLNTMGLLKSSAISEALWDYFRTKRPRQLKHLNIRNKRQWDHFYQDGSAFIKAKNQPGTDLISLQFAWSDAETAREGLMVIVQAFQEASRNLNKGEQISKTRYLNRQMAEIEKQLEGVRREKSAYQSKKRTVSLKREGDDLAGSRMELSNKLSQLESQARGKANMAGHYSRLLGMSSQYALHAAALGQNSTMGKLQDELYRLEQHYAQLRTSLTDTNPKVQEVAAQIEQTRASIQAERGRTLGGNGGHSGAVVADGARGTLISQMVQASGEAQDLQTQASMIRRRLGEINHDIGAFPEMAEALAHIEQKELSLSTALDQLRQKVLEGKLQEEQTLSNVFVVDPPRLPEQAQFPTRNHLLALSVMMGLGVGVAAAFLREQWASGRRYSTPEWMQPMDDEPKGTPWGGAQQRMDQASPWEQSGHPVAHPNEHFAPHPAWEPSVMEPMLTGVPMHAIHSGNGAGEHHENGNGRFMASSMPETTSLNGAAPADHPAMPKEAFLGGNWTEIESNRPETDSEDWDGPEPPEPPEQPKPPHPERRPVTHPWGAWETVTESESSELESSESNPSERPGSEPSPAAQESASVVEKTTNAPFEEPAPREPAKREQNPLRPLEPLPLADEQTVEAPAQELAPIAPVKPTVRRADRIDPAVLALLRAERALQTGPQSVVPALHVISLPDDPGAARVGRSNAGLPLYRASTASTGDVAVESPHDDRFSTLSGPEVDMPSTPLSPMETVPAAITESLKDTTGISGPALYEAHAREMPLPRRRNPIPAFLLADRRSPGREEPYKLLPRKSLRVVPPVCPNPAPQVSPVEPIREEASIETPKPSMSLRVLPSAPKSRTTLSDNAPDNAPDSTPDTPETELSVTASLSRTVSPPALSKAPHPMAAETVLDLAYALDPVSAETEQAVPEFVFEMEDDDSDSDDDSHWGAPPLIAAEPAAQAPATPEPSASEPIIGTPAKVALLPVPTESLPKASPTVATLEVLWEQAVKEALPTIETVCSLDRAANDRAAATANGLLPVVGKPIRKPEQFFGLAARSHRQSAAPPSLSRMMHALARHS